MTDPPTSAPFDLDQDTLDSLESLLISSNGLLERAHVGKLIKARFLAADDRELYFDIGEKQEGICPRDEFTTTPDLGEEFFVIVLEREADGPARLSKKAADHRIVWQDIKEAYEAQANLSGKVSRIVPSGYLVDYEGLELFLPFSHTGISHSGQRLKTGRQIDFKVLELKERYPSAIISHRRVIEERNDSLWDQFLQNHKVGDIVEGVIVKKVAFGIFLEVEGLIALLHANDISWKRRDTFKNKFHLKSKLVVKILSMDRENNRLNLGLKQLSEDPWEWAQRELQPGQRVKARVGSLIDYGAFLEVREGLEGLLHTNEMSWNQKKRHPKEYLQLGQEVEVKVLDINKEDRRISFSLKQLVSDPWSVIGESIRVGELCSGRVTGVTEFGTFVQIRDGVEGLIHCKDYTWQGPNKKTMFRKGQTIRFKILDINQKERRIACGYKQLSDSPHLAFKKKHPKGSVLTGKIKRIASFGLSISLDNDIEGTVSITEAALKSDQKLSDVYKVEDQLEAVLQDVDLNKKRIYLSVKAYHKKEESDIMKQYLKSENTPSTSNPFARFLDDQQNKEK